jgi:hypothetical protein
LKFFATAFSSPIGLTSLLIVIGMSLSNILINVGWTSTANGQTVKSPFPEFPMIPSSNTTSTNLTTKPSQVTPPPSSSGSQLSSSSVEHGVRITSPTKNQQVPAGILTISGRSKDNTTSDCRVNIIVNHARPYQNTSANGPGGATDYSNWTFTLTPKYTLIRQGENEITAKFFCNPNPDIASFYSVNVIGVPTTKTATAGGAQEGRIAPPVTSNSSITSKASIVNTTNQNHQQP